MARIRIRTRNPYKALSVLKAASKKRKTSIQSPTKIHDLLMKEVLQGFMETLREIGKLGEKS